MSPFTHRIKKFVLMTHMNIQEVMKKLVVRLTHQLELDAQNEPVTLQHIQQLKSELASRSNSNDSFHEHRSKDSGAGATRVSIKSRASGWSGVTDTDLGDNII